MQIIKEYYERLCLRQILEEGSIAIKEPESGRLRRQRRELRQERTSLSHLGNDLSDSGSAGPQDGRDGLRGALVESRAEDLHPGPEGRSTLALITGAEQDPCALETRIASEFLSDPGLADAWISNQQHEPSGPGAHVFEVRVESRHFWFTPDKYLTRQERGGAEQVGRRLESIEWHTRMDSLLQAS